MNVITLMSHIGKYARKRTTWSRYLLRLCKQRIVRMQRAYYIYMPVAAVRYVKGALC